MRKLILFALLLVFAFPVSAFCATAPTTNQLQALATINNKIAVVDELVNRKVITAEEQAAADQLYLGDAKNILGYAVTPHELQVLVANQEQQSGLSVFWNIVIVIAGILFLFGLVGLIAYYLRDILAQIPPGVYEFFAYVATAITALSGYFWHPFHLGIVAVEPLWFVIPGALALAGSLFLTHQLHFSSGGRRSETVLMGPGFIDFPTVMFLVCTIVWASMAVFYHGLFPDAGVPHVLAFGAIIALQACLGFSVVTMPGAIALGWDSDDQVPKSVFSSMLILVAYVFMKLTHHLTGNLELFEPGAVFMGAFVYYLGLLVMASKWYIWNKKDSNGSNYVFLQVITIASGIAALYLGSTFHLGALLGVGGTFFAIYLLEKYYEIPWKGVGWAWSFFGVAAFLYFVVAFANKNPQYFIWGIQ